MDKIQLKQIEDLNFALYSNLKILICAIKSFDETLETCDVLYIIEILYENSNRIKEIFENTIY